MVGYDMVLAGGERAMELVSCPEEYLDLHTANGHTVVNREVPVRVKHLNEVVRALVLDSTPPVLSVGLRCVDHGYSFLLGPRITSPGVDCA